MDATKFEVTLLVGPLHERFAKKNEEELNHFVEQSHSELGDDQLENNNLVYINLSRLTMHSGN